MLSFENDYLAGAHPEVLRRLLETNLEPMPGYGGDPYSESARAKIRLACGDPAAAVEFLAGGTQANALVLSTLLRDWEGVLSPVTGHIEAHEAGAIEYSGHKVLPLPQEKGKVSPEALQAWLDAFEADENREHLVFPGVLYISHPTEYGTLYRLGELRELSRICREHSLRLYLDGARLGYGLMSLDTDVTLPDLARLCDAFTVGGTKVGALCGEAVVFPRGGAPDHFLNRVKKRGGLLAKGRLLGVQFDALFTDELYFRLSREAILRAEEMKAVFRKKGLPFFLDSPTNQQFLLLENGYLEALGKKLRFCFWERADEKRSVVRFACSWSTTSEDLASLEAAL